MGLIKNPELQSPSLLSLSLSLPHTRSVFRIGAVVIVTILLLLPLL